MSPFKRNMYCHQKINSSLLKYGLELAGGVVIDNTLPPYMHSIICKLDHTKIDLEGDFNISEYPLIANYINGGRECYINQFIKEQSEAHAYSNDLTRKLQ